MKDEYIIINKTTLQKRIEELEKSNEAMWWKERDSLKQILSQSTSLIPEIEKAIDAPKKYPWSSNVKKDYISNLKLDI
jgi:hypothetical protein